MAKVFSGTALLVLGLATWCGLGPAVSAGAADDLESLNNRVVELYQQGDYAAATKVAEQAVKVAETELGREAAEIATPINNLAALYEAQGSSLPLGTAGMRAALVVTFCTPSRVSI